MIIRYLTSPIRMLLGLPPVYGIRIRDRILQLLRAAGLYRGHIHFRCKAKPIHVGLQASKG